MTQVPTKKFHFAESSKMSQISPLETVDCEGDHASVGRKLEDWKRALKIYLLAANVNKLENKRASLLHMGGLALQEI